MKEGALNPIPEYYQSPTGDVYVDMLRGRQDVYTSTLRLKKVFDIAVAVPAAVFDFMSMTTTPGEASIEVEHETKGGAIIVEIYTQIVTENLVISNAKVDNKVFTSNVVNYNTSFSGTVNIRAHVYQILTR